MQILLVMVPLMIVSAGGLLALFAWAVRDGQFEALEDAKHRIFFGD